jgi:DNA-binding CsgD family transcriptional regulator
MATLPFHLASRGARVQSLCRLLNASSGPDLTPRQTEGCARIVLGYSILAISLELGITQNTVSTLRKRAYSRLGICSQNELFALCLEGFLNAPAFSHFTPPMDRLPAISLIPA